MYGAGVGAQRHGEALMGYVQPVERFETVRPRSTSGTKQAQRFQLYMAQAGLDCLAILLGFASASLLRWHGLPSYGGLHLAALMVPLFLVGALNGRAYSNNALADWTFGLRAALSALVVAAAIVLFVMFYARASLDVSRLVFAGGFLSAALCLTSERWLFRRVVAHTMGESLRSEIVIVDNCAAPSFAGARVIDAAAHGLRPNLRDPHMLDRLGNAVRGADFVLVCCAPEDRSAWALLLKGTDVHGHVMAPEFDQVGATRLGRFEGHCVMQVSSGPLNLRGRLLKRAMDLALTVPALILLSPVLMLIAIAIKLDSRGPVLFRQQRMGRGNRLFTMLKFRSMRTDQCDADGNRSASRTDDRVTRVGKVIRSLSLDELPQLLNVLHGDMSLIGPRPHALGSLAGLERFWDVDQRYWHRHALKPGITGLAQVRGLRGATAKREDLVRRLQADMEYLNGWTLWRDVSILLATVRVVAHRNAF